MGKVYRQDRKSVQRIKARDIVPGDIVEVAGKTHFCIAYMYQHSSVKLLWGPYLNDLRPWGEFSKTPKYVLSLKNSLASLHL